MITKAYLIYMYKNNKKYLFYLYMKKKDPYLHQNLRPIAFRHKIFKTKMSHFHWTVMSPTCAQLRNKLADQSHTALSHPGDTGEFKCTAIG